MKRFIKAIIGIAAVLVVVEVVVYVVTLRADNAYLMAVVDQQDAALQVYDGALRLCTDSLAKPHRLTREPIAIQ